MNILLDLGVSALIWFIFTIIWSIFKKETIEEFNFRLLFMVIVWIIVNLIYYGFK